jgi:hypothetical protein
MKLGKIRKWMVWTVAIVMLAGAAYAAKQVYNFKGGVKTRADQGLTKAQLAITPDQGSFFTWTYTFVGYLDDDSSMMIQFTYWKLAVMAERGMYFAFYDKGDKVIMRKDVVKADAAKYTPDPPTFIMGPHSWKGFYPEFDVKVNFPATEKEPEMKADLHFKCRTPGWRPGEGAVHYGSPDGDWYDLVVMIPWADLSGTVTVNGQTRQIKGWGYSDHNTQNVFPTSQVDTILALRSFNDQYAVNFLEYIAPADFDRARTTWLLIMKGNQVLYATDQWKYTTSGDQTEPRRGNKYPTRMSISVDQPDCKLTGELKGVKFIGTMDVMDNLPDFVRTVAEKFFSAPVFIRQNVVVDYHLTMPGAGLDEKFQTKGVMETNIAK